MFFSWTGDRPAELEELAVMETLDNPENIVKYSICHSSM